LLSTPDIIVIIPSKYIVLLSKYSLLSSNQNILTNSTASAKPVVSIIILSNKFCFYVNNCSIVDIKSDFAEQHKHPPDNS